MEPSQVHVSSPYVKNLDAWKAWNVNVTTDNSKVVQESDVVFLAVKPHLLDEVIDTLSDSKKAIRKKLFVSILAGIPLKRLESVSINRSV